MSKEHWTFVMVALVAVAAVGMLVAIWTWDGRWAGTSGVFLFLAFMAGFPRIEAE